MRSTAVHRAGRDPRTLLVCAIALVVYVLHGFDGFLSRDLGVYAYGGQQVADGVPPYVGILNRAGPLAQLIPAIGVAGARVGGIDDLLGMRLLFLVISVVCVGLVYVLGRAVFDSRLAGIAAAAAFLSFHGFIEYASNGPREKTPMVLFMVCVLLALAKRRWVVAGFFVGMATLVWQPAFVVGLAAAVVAALMAPHPAGRLGALVRIAAGGLVPAVVCVGYFAFVGALQEFLDAFLLINARYTSAVPLTTNFAHKWANLQHGYGVTVWVMIAGLVAALALGLVAVARGARRLPASAPTVSVAVATAAALAWSFRAYNGWPDAFVLLPMAALGVGGLVAVVAARLPGKVALSVTLAWVVAATAIAVTYSVGARNHELERQRESVAAVLEALPPGATILSIEAPQALVLSGKTNPTRHQMFSRDLERRIDDTWPGGLDGFADRVRRLRPEAIAVSNRRPEGPPWLAEEIASEYRRMGQAPGWKWYVRR